MRMCGAYRRNASGSDTKQTTMNNCIKTTLLALAALLATGASAQQRAPEPKLLTVGSVTDAAPSPADNTCAVQGTIVSGFDLRGQATTAKGRPARKQSAVRDSLAAASRPRTGCLSARKAIFVSGRNSYVANAIPIAMRGKLSELQSLGQRITDVCVTDMGWWAVAYDGTHIDGELPASLDAAIDSLTTAGEHIMSISISGDGSYAYVTDRSYGASGLQDEATLREAADAFGIPLSVSLTSGGCLVVCDRGIYVRNVPKSVCDQLLAMGHKATVVRFTDSGTWIATDGLGFSAANM